jgi:hypothetical protein
VNVWQPHSPYLHERDCSRRESVIPHGTLDRLEERMAHYADETYCANRQVLELIAFLRERDPNALIVIHSDHGHGFFTDWRVPNDQWSEAAIASRTSVLWAARLPAECRASLYPTITPVNTFRVLLACILGVDPVTVPDRTYLTSFFEPGIGEFHEIGPVAERTAPR